MCSLLGTGFQVAVFRTLDSKYYVNMGLRSVEGTQDETMELSLRSSCEVLGGVLGA